MPETHVVINKIATFETTFDKNTVKGKFKNRWGGVIAPKLHWSD